MPPAVNQLLLSDVTLAGNLISSVFVEISHYSQVHSCEIKMYHFMRIRILSIIC